jgi:hypothetical protein
MGCLRFAGTVAAVASIACASAPPVSAGVVMAETSTERSPAGETSQNKTVYVQGNKQKVEGERIDTITDLDKSVIYVIDKNRRAYAQVPLKAFQSLRPPEERNKIIITLSKTGKTQVIAKNSCNEYRRTAGSTMEKTTVSACVSRGAPGANEVTAFERKMRSRLIGGNSAGWAKNGAPALVLEQQSSVSFRVPDRSGSSAYHIGSLLSKTQISDIQLKPLPADTFKPPGGFSKFQNQLPEGVPPDDRSTPVESIEAIAPHSPHHRESSHV